jgi:hypothetical protein
MAGRWQHYLSASYLGGFGETTAAHARETVLWVGRRDKRPFPHKAERVGAARDLYTLREPRHFDAGLVDNVWGGVEGYFQVAIQRLIESRSPVDPSDGVMHADLWLKVLVPFVTQFFVRGPDFSERMRYRMGEHLYRYLSTWPNHHNHARLLEYQRLLSVFAGADWKVYHYPPDVRVIGTDTGRAWMHGSITKFRGYLIPLRRDAVLAVSTQKDSKGPRLLAGTSVGGDDKWFTYPIKHEDAGHARARWMNEALVGHARYEIYGASEREVTELIPFMGDRRPSVVSLEPYVLASHKEIQTLDIHFYRLVSLLAKPPSAWKGEFNISKVEVDFNAVRAIIPYFLYPKGDVFPERLGPKPEGTLLVDIDPSEFPHVTRHDEAADDVPSA